MKITRTIVIVLVSMLAASSVLVSAQGGDVIRGGTVVVSEGQQAPFVRNFNPYAPDPTRWTLGTIYETLTLYNPVEGGRPTDWLATDFVWADNLMSLTYILRQGVRWSDGEDFNADDVVFTFTLLLSAPEIDRGGIGTFVTGVEKVDDYTVKVNLGKVYTLAPEVIGGNVYIVPEHIWSGIDDVETFTNPDPVGTGMLTTVANLTDQVLELCRNEYYWQMGEDGQPLPYIDCMRMPMFPGNDPANLAAVNGELDWIGNFIADIDNTFVAANPEMHHYYFWPGGPMVQFYLNTTKAPYDDVTFRQALGMAIDYEAVTSIAMYGYTTPGSPTGLGPRYASWISAEAEARAAGMGLGVYNPDAAAAVLDAAGYADANGDGWRDMPDGADLTFKVQVVEGWTDWVTSVQIISQNFQDIGLNASSETLDHSVWLNNLQTGAYDTSIGWGTAGNTPWDHFRSILDSSLISADGLANGELWGRWTSPETDDLINAFTATADPVEQQDIVNQLQMIYIENVITIPLAPNPTWYEWTTYHFTGWPTEDDYYAQGSPWNWQGRLITLTRLHCVSEAACAQAQ